MHGGCIINAGGGGSTLVGPAWGGVCVINTGGGHPRGRVGPHVINSMVVNVGGLSMGWWLCCQCRQGGS